jgi:hypothetical protein
MTILAVWISVEFRFRVLLVKMMGGFPVVSFPVEMNRRPSVCDDVMCTLRAKQRRKKRTRAGECQERKSLS